MRAVALVLTLLTGFSGLVYEVAWQRYLATLLGSHGEATAAVLGIFLGGLAAGYVLFGRVSRRIVETAPPGGARGRVLRAYGLIEVGIGLYAAVFPQLFAAARALSLLLPGGHEALVFGLDVLLAAALIGPPTVLMGGTIPLLTQALARDLDDATRLHSLVYASNTAGAFLGALSAGFVLLPWLGLEGCIRVVALTNVVAGSVFLLFGTSLSRSGEALEVTPAAPTPAAAPGISAFGSYALVALLSGFALMTLQTAANRVGALALGASHFTFAMVVAVFVLCIAIGSFAVSALPAVRSSYLALSQWILVAYLLLLYPLVENATYYAHVLRLTFTSLPTSFIPHQMAIFAALLALCLVPLALAGALLPLLFHHLRHESSDLGDIAGRLYGWNTAGSVVGALLGGYALFFWLDLDQLFRLAVLALAIGAAILTRRILPGRLVPATALGLVAATLLAQPAWSPKKLTAGLFRGRTPMSHSHDGAEVFFREFAPIWGEDYVLFHDDDPTASIAVFRTPAPGGGAGRSIVVNGKSDGNIPEDNLTTGLLALLPCLHAERCERAFVIGYGTGMTAGELAALDSVEEVAVAEISPGVVAAAPLFESINRGAFASPKTRILRSDAYRALLRSEGRWDVIVSEPSNPWVTGVEMLYSREFLDAARAKLAPGGVYAQWFHVYETDDESVALVLRTFRESFADVSVWFTGPDLVILGFDGREGWGDLDRVAGRAGQPAVRAQLAAFGVDSLGELLAHEVVPRGVLAATPLPGRVHTLLHPVLSDTAARAFFSGGNGWLPETWAHAEAAAIGARSSLVRRARAKLEGEVLEGFRRDVALQTCRFRLELCATLFAEWQHEAPDSPELSRLLEQARRSRKPEVASALATEAVDELAALFGELAGADPGATERAFDRHYHHAAPFGPREQPVARR